MSGTSQTTAVGAASFIGSIGVNTHIDFTWTAYANIAEVEAALSYLGVANVRDSPSNPADLQWWQQVAQATGVKFDAFIGEGSPASYSSELGLMQQLAGEGLLNFVEGGNEPDDSYAESTGDSTSYAAQFQQTLYQTAHALGLPVIQTSFGNVNDYGSTGDLSAYADYGNAHTYYGTGNNPGATAWWNGQSYASSLSWLNSEASLTTPGKPIITTESGYYTDGNTADPNNVDETVQAKYTLDILLDAYKAGDAKTYLYELLDQNTGDGNSEDNFGLFHSDGTPKLAATAVHDLTTLLNDPGATAASFVPGTLNYSLTGMSATENSLLMEKSDGSFWLALWNDTRLSGPSSPTDVAVAPNTVTLTLANAAAVQVFDPLAGTAATENYGTTTSAQISVPDHAILVEIAPPQSSNSTTVLANQASSSPGNLLYPSAGAVLTVTGADTVIGHAGALTVNVATGGTPMIFASAASLFFSGGSQAATVVGGSGADTIFANAGGGQVWGGSGDMLFVGGSGVSTAVGGSGMNTLFAGSSGRDMLVAGSGASTLVGSGSGGILVGLGSVQDVLVAGVGNETLVGSAGGGSDVLYANAGTDVMFGGSGSTLLVAAAGNAQMVGGSGQDLFVFDNGAAGGNDVIWNFVQGRDHVGLYNYGANAASTILQNAVVASGSTTLTLPDNTRITFGTLTHLTSSDFITG